MCYDDKQNLDEIKDFLGKYKQPKLTKTQAERLTRKKILTIA